MTEIIIGAAAALVSAGVTAATGAEQSRVARAGLRRQKKAQGDQEQQAIRQQRRGEVEQKRAENASQLDINAILLGERGGLPTMLTGANGVSMDGLRLGRRSLFGAGSGGGAR